MIRNMIRYVLNLRFIGPLDNRVGTDPLLAKFHLNQARETVTGLSQFVSFTRTTTYDNIYIYIYKNNFFPHIADAAVEYW